jgi:Reverse transcriptase (RNA-dependent DNA polymerase)
VVAIDMAKAFDTLSHDYLDKVYKFFNFGPNMQRWLSLLGNNREACIALEDGKSTPYFRLETGRPQGDNISPNTFNFGAQILIFKIELDPLIKSIPRNINRFVIPGTFFGEESNRETDKNESLADDNTSITLMEEESLTQTKVNLELFANLSGLHCNFNKTCIMTTYEPDQETIELANNLNFKLTDRFTLLGIEITRNLDNVDNIFEKIKNKIIGLASFWERFRLSLPGRVTVAKTFLVSQLSYVACFLTPGERIANDIQLILDNFVRKNLNISRERMYLDAASGGVGMFNIKNFFCSQR